MKCPTDGTTLTMSERGGIEIDYCPECRGVWLDRGELDKILVKERQLSAGDPDEDFFAEVQGAPAAPKRPAPARPSHDDDRHHGDPRKDKKRRRKSFLEDLLDF